MDAPGNVALAVGGSIAYGKYKKEENALLSRMLVQRQFLDGRLKPRCGYFDGVILSVSGISHSMSMRRRLRRKARKRDFGTAFQVYAADFVTTGDGTGIVHTAVMYGQEDFELGNKVGLPKVHLVNPEGEVYSRNRIPHWAFCW